MLPVKYLGEEMIYLHGGNQLHALRVKELITTKWVEYNIGSEQKVINERCRDCCSEFYTSEFRDDLNVTENILSNLNIAFLPQDFNNFPEAPVTQKEITASSSMQSDQFLGWGGLPSRDSYFTDSLFIFHFFWLFKSGALLPCFLQANIIDQHHY